MAWNGKAANEITIELVPALGRFAVPFPFRLMTGTVVECNGVDVRFLEFDGSGDMAWHGIA